MPSIAKLLLAASIPESRPQVVETAFVFALDGELLIAVTLNVDGAETVLVFAFSETLRPVSALLVVRTNEKGTDGTEEGRRLTCFWRYHRRWYFELSYLLGMKCQWLSPHRYTGADSRGSVVGAVREEDMIVGEECSLRERPVW